MTDEWALSKQLCFGKVAQRVLGNGRTDLPTDMIAFTDITRSTEEREREKKGLERMDKVEAV